ncbi:nuclear transport factor 2 family protein [Ferruginibacter sp.]
MKKYIYIVCLLTSLNAAAQGKQDRAVMSKSQQLMDIVFGSKDSASLDALFAKTLIYGHSSGKIQNREEAIQGIIHNKSVYTEKGITPLSVRKSGDSVIVTKVFNATEKKGDGTEAPLNISIDMVWIKESGEWKLARRQAYKIQ